MHWNKWIRSSSLEVLHLSTGDVDGSHQVGSVCVISTNAARHGRAHQVLADVDLHQSFCCRFQNLQHRDKERKLSSNDRVQLILKVLI